MIVNGDAGRIWKRAAKLYRARYRTRKRTIDDQRKEIGRLQELVDAWLARDELLNG